MIIIICFDGSSFCEFVDMKSCQITHKKPYHLDTSNNLVECYYSYTIVGRSFFSTRLGPKGVLPEGL